MFFNTVARGTRFRDKADDGKRFPIDLSNRTPAKDNDIVR
jgi:hypothetical protein